MWELWLFILILCILLFIWTNYQHGLSISICSALTLLLSLFTYQVGVQLFFYLLLFYWLRRHPIHLNFLSSTKPSATLKELIGLHATVKQDIGSSYLESGTIRLKGELWQAYSYDQTPIASGTVVKVLAIQGVHLIVSPVSTS